MATTKQDIKRWFERGLEEKVTHLIVVCDTFNYEDYPVFVYPHQDLTAVLSNYNEVNMQRVMEVYNLSKDMDSQLNKYRNFEY